MPLTPFLFTPGLVITIYSSLKYLFLVTVQSLLLAQALSCFLLLSALNSQHLPCPLYSARVSASNEFTPSSTLSTRDSIALTRASVSYLPILQDWSIESIASDSDLILSSKVTRSQSLTSLIQTCSVTRRPGLQGDLPGLCSGHPGHHPTAIAHLKGRLVHGKPGWRCK